MADFILEHLPDSIYQKWDKDILLGWIDWHEDHGFIQKVFDFDNTLVGLSISRTIMNPKDASDFYAYDPEGSVIFVDLAIATKPEVFKALIITGRKRHGFRDLIAWQRPPYHVTEFHDAHRFHRIVFRKTGVRV